MPKKKKKRTKTVKGLNHGEYMAMCKELKTIIPGRKIKSCTKRWQKGLDP